MIRFVALGTSGTFPTDKRNHPSFYFEYKGIGILLDCGENTQRQMKIAKISVTKLKYILITHWHGDHVLGLPGILFSLANSEYNKELNIILPKGYKNNLEMLIEAYKIPINFDINIKEVNSKERIEDKEFFIEILPVKHDIETLAYSIKQKDYWKLINEKLKEYGLFGKHKLLEELKAKGKIFYKGKEIKVNEIGYLKKGFKFTYITDTLFFDDLIEFSRDSDILLIESMYYNNKEMAENYKHLDFSDVLKIKEKSNSKIVLLTHFSQRYEEELDKIKEIIENLYFDIYLLKDFDKFIYEKNIIELNIGGKIIRYKRDEKTGDISKV